MDEPASPGLCVSIVNFRTPHHCIACLESLLPERADVPNLRIVVADGNSGDDSCAIIGEWIERAGHADWITLLPLALNGGFGWAHNQIMLRALQSDQPPDYFYLLNPDALVLPGTLRATLDEMEADPSRAVTGGLMYNGDHVLQISAHRFPDWRSELARAAYLPRLATVLGHHSIGLMSGAEPREVDWISGSNFMIRSEAMRQCGLFDDGFFLYSEEIEWMWRLRRHGWTIWQTPHGGITHEGGAATKVSRDPEVRRRTALPAYWYRSERRLLTLAYGVGKARMIFMMWLMARLLVGMPRWFLLPRIRAGAVYRDLRNKWAAWREPVARAAVPAVARWDDPPGVPPAWVAWS